MIEVTEKRASVVCEIKSVPVDGEWITGIEHAIAVQHALLAMSDKVGRHTGQRATARQHKLGIVPDNAADAPLVSSVR
ncbi:hypothetical protein WL02_08880 [Burkholderia ubonensis]|nr:hypothetical protein WL02_08880 [Burkholderia ubonensis]